MIPKGQVVIEQGSFLIKQKAIMNKSYNLVGKQ